MTEKVEWEVVDESSLGKRPTIRQLMKTLLGPWWRWKIAGAAIVGAATAVFFAALAGLLVLVLAAGAIVSIGTFKLRQWLHRDHRSFPLKRK